DKMNLALHAEGKKKVNPLVISGVRFTKLIINHLQSKHKFHKRPGSLLHLPIEESALGYLKFSFKNTKRVRFGMAIEEIRTASYYSEYVAKVIKYQRYLAEEAISDDDAPAPKPAKGATTKSTRKLKPTPQLVDEFVDEGVPDKEPMHGDEEADTQRAIEESLKEAQGAHRGPLPPVVFREPDTGKIQPLPEVEGKGKEKVGEEQAAQVLLNLQTPKKKNPAEQFIFQRRTPAITEPSGLVESSSLYAKLGLTDSGTDSDEEVSPDMNAQGQEEGQGGTNPGDAGVSQTPSSHVVYAGPNLDHMDLGIAEASSQPNTEQMDDEFTSTAYPKIQENLKLPTEGDVRLEEPASSAGTLSSMKNLDKEFSFTDQFLVEKSQEDEPEKTNTEAEVQSMVTVPIHQDTSSVPLMTTPVIDITDPQSDSTTIPASMPTTTATVTKTTTTTVPPLPPQPQQGTEGNNDLHQFETLPVSRLIREQTVEFIDSQEIDRKIEESVKEVVPASVQHAMRAPLHTRFKDIPTSDMKEILLQRMLEENYDKGHEDHKMAFEALQKSIIHDESEQFDADMAEERTKKKSKQDLPKTSPGSPPPPPPPPPPSGALGASGPTGTSDSAQDPPPPPLSSTINRGDKSQSSAAPGSSKTTASTEYTAWTTTTSSLKPAASSVPEDVLMHEESDFKAQYMGSDDEDRGSRHIPKVSLNQEWFKPLFKKERLATPEPAWSIPSSSLPVPNNNWASALASIFVPPPEKSLLSQTGDIGVFIDWFCKKQGITELTPKHLEGPAYEVVKAFHLDVIHLQFQMEECHKLLTNQVDDRIIRLYVSGTLPIGWSSRLALSITKMKAASYPDAGLEQMVPDQMWAEEEYMYDISASYGISHWWFKRQQFYIDRHSADTNRRAIVRTHMRILSVIRIEVFSLYGYDYMKKIVLRRADNQEYTIAESDFKDLYPSDFEDLYLLNLQGKTVWVRQYFLPAWIESCPDSAGTLPQNLLEATCLARTSIGMPDDHGFTKIPHVQGLGLKQIDASLRYRDLGIRRLTRSNPGLIELNTRFGPREDGQGKQVGPYGSGGSSKDGDGDTSFQWSQFTTPCSHLIRNCPINLTELLKKKQLAQGARTLGLRGSKKNCNPGSLSLFLSSYGRWCFNRFELNNTIPVSKNNVVYFTAIPRDGLYEIEMSCSNTNDSSIYVVSNKRAKLNLDSSLLWHCRLRHISKKHIEKLQHDGLLNFTDIESLGMCVSCMSGKMARKPYSYQVERAKDLLGLIHTDVCGPFRIVSRQGANYFVTFTDDFSRDARVFVARNCEFFEVNIIITQEASGSLEDLEIIQEEDMHPSINTSLNHKEDDQVIDEPQSDINPIRKSTRIHRAPDRMCLHVDAEEHDLGDLGEPANYKVALLDPESKKWLDAINVKMQSMKHNDGWDLVDLPPNGKTVGSKWLFKKKTDMDGAVHAFKARLVAKGFTQTYRVDYEETSSPVSDIRAIGILIAIVAL
ncbi:E-beta-farnesene synthase, partial [Tanacetum coccineum]